MTICIFHEETIYADRAGMTTGDRAYPVEMKKLFLLSKGTIAIAVSGKPFDQTDPVFKKFIAFMRKNAKIAAALKSHILVTDELTAFLGERSLIVMTKHAAFDYWDPSEFKKNETKNGMFGLFDETYPHFIGSGRDYASIAMVAGKTPEEAMNIAATIDEIGYLSKIDKISRSELKDY